MEPPRLYWFTVTTTYATGKVAVDQYDCIQRVPRAFAWWLGRPMATFTDTLRQRGALVSVEPI